MRYFRDLICFILICWAAGQVSCLSSRCELKNFTHPAGPVYLDTTLAETITSFTDTIMVVSFNIKFARQTSEAIELFREHEKLKQADIILLQEMESDSTRKIAETLNLNYIYFPAVRHYHHCQEFGNAVLSRWPIQDPQKIILPHLNPFNQQQRIAVASTIVIHDKKIRVYSAHTETIVLPQELRQNQMEAIVETIPDSMYCIIGGDFNTGLPFDITLISNSFEDAGLQRATSGITPTVSFFPKALDHIFIRGMEVLEKGKADVFISDHFPIWVKLRFIENDFFVNNNSSVN